MRLDTTLLLFKTGSERSKIREKNRVSKKLREQPGEFLEGEGFCFFWLIENETKPVTRDTSREMRERRV